MQASTHSRTCAFDSKYNLDFIVQHILFIAKGNHYLVLYDGCPLIVACVRNKLPL